jgi:hypothetical protein
MALYPVCLALISQEIFGTEYINAIENPEEEISPNLIKIWGSLFVVSMGLLGNQQTYD